LRDGEEFRHPAREVNMQQAAIELKPIRFAGRESIVVAGLTERYTPLTKVQIPVLWQRFVPWLGDIPERAGEETFGVCFNYGTDGSFGYLAGVRVTEAVSLPTELTAIEIPAATYAVFAHTGPVSTIGATWQAIFHQWLPASGCTLEGEPNFELYTDQFDPRTGTGLVEIWVPLKAGTEV
jgi:AraC family transcriptional regulator